MLSSRVVLNAEKKTRYTELSCIPNLIRARFIPRLPQDHADIGDKVATKHPSDTTPEGSVPGEPAVQPKKKKRTSRNTKSFQDFEKKFSKSAHRVSQAVEKGVQAYIDGRDKSANKLKDGAMIESYVNVASGISEGIADAAPALTDFADAVNTKGMRRIMKNVVRSMPFPFPR
jgi:hypothetical protein